MEKGGAKNYNLMATGMVIFTQCVLISNFKILNFSNTYHPFSFLIILASILFYVLSVLAINSIDMFDSNLFSTLVVYQKYIKICIFLKAYLNLHIVILLVSWLFLERICSIAQEIGCLVNRNYE